MPNKPIHSGTIIVILCIICMGYYYVIFRHSFARDLRNHQIEVDNSTIYQLTK